MYSLKQMCQIVDEFIAESSSSQFESVLEFWHGLSTSPKDAQMYTECLIYKYIALSYGLDQRPLFQTLSQIKNIVSPGGGGGKPPGSPASPSASANSSPRGSLTSSGRTKHAGENSENHSSEVKKTPKRLRISRRKSDDKRSVKHNDDAPDDGHSRKMSSNKTSDANEDSEEGDKRLQCCLENILLTLNYMSKMCDLTEWDFSKLREVFLTWNKARGWEQNASNYEYAVMKRFSLSPSNVTEEKLFADILSSCNKELGELSILKNREVGESIRYWEARRRILSKPEATTDLINSLLDMAKKILEEGDETKILPLLHLFCEVTILSPHTPLELLQECYRTFELFYVWPEFVSRPIKETLDLIQLEMKCPGLFFRMIFFQDQEVALTHRLKAKMPKSTTHVFIDEDIPNSTAFAEYCKRTHESCSSSAKLRDQSEKYRFTISHIFESVFGKECCDLITLESALKVCPSESLQELSCEALGILESASMMNSHENAQDHLRRELEIFSEKLVDIFEEKESEEVNKQHPKSDSLGVHAPMGRRVSVLFDSYRLRDPTSPSHSLLKTNCNESSSPRRNNSYLRRTSSGTIDNQVSVKKSSRSMEARKIIPGKLLGSKMNISTFNEEDLSETIFGIVRETAKTHLNEIKEGARHEFKRKRNSSHFNYQEGVRDSGVIEDTPLTPVPRLSIDMEDVTATSVVLRSDKTASSVFRTSLSGKKIDVLTHMTEEGDSSNLWNKFLENGFSNPDSQELEMLLQSMTIDQRKSFLLEQKQVVVPKHLKKDHSETPEMPFEPTVTTGSDEPQVETTPDSDGNVKMRRDVVRCERKKSNRISQFRKGGMRMVRNRLKNKMHIKKEEDLEKISSAESLSSVSSTPSSSTSDELNDGPIPRWRTTSDPLYRKSLRAKRNRGDANSSTTTPTSRNKRDSLIVDIDPKSPFSSVRSLPAKERKSLFSSVDTLHEDEATNEECMFPQSPKNEAEESQPPSSSRTEPEAQSVEDDGDSRRRIDSGIGQENIQDYSKGTIMISRSSHNGHDSLGVGGIKLGLRDILRSGQRCGTSGWLEARTQKRILKLLFVGNDKTLCRMAKAYYELRKRHTSRAPLLQHVDLRMYFIPVSATNLGEVDTNCDVRTGELLGTYDTWYHTVVMMSTNNLLRVFPRISSANATEIMNEEEIDVKHKLSSPNEIITNVLMYYSRFAVSIKYIPLYKVAMVTSTGKSVTDIFCCGLQIGHAVYTKAVKAGRFGKLGKLVDLSEDSGPPPAYSKIEYSKWSIDETLIYNGKMEEAFYHTVRLAPMSVMKESYRGRGVLHLYVLENDKKTKNVRRTPSNKSGGVEEMDSGTKLSIGSMKMDVMRPTQGTFSVLVDDSRIYTSIKSIEVLPCPAPGTEVFHRKRRNTSKRVDDHLLMRLPVRTFWTADN